MTLFDLSDTTVVVVAGTSTLGRAMAEGLARHGAAVAITSRDEGRARRVVERLRAAGGAGATWVRTDATDREDLERALAHVLDWKGRVDVVFNCPGKNSTTPVLELDLEEWRDLMATNVESALLSCQVFAREMIRAGRGGCIVNVSSVSAGPPLSRVPAYSASKAALENLTLYLARELAPHDIRVNALVPGFFPAEQNRAVLSPERKAAILAHTPMRRFGEPHELQGAAVWLASRAASSFVTGATIRVDGGFGAVTI